MSVALNIGTHASTDEAEDLKGRYLVSLKLIERLHRLLLDVIKDEFERLGRVDVNSVQALLLYNIGDAELTAGELTSRGYYLGSNVSYNLKKLSMPATSAISAPPPTAGRCESASPRRGRKCARW